MSDYALHPLCTLFARMQGAEFEALCADIRANGLQQPIVLFEGMVLDGGNRYRACQAAGVEARFVEFAGDDPAGFVLSANLHRRHMEAGQRAAVVSLAQDWRQAQGRGGGRKSKSQEATLPLEKQKSTIADRATRSETSERTQKVADKVAKASPELARKVALGEISLPKAAAQLEPPRPARAAKSAPPAPQMTPAGEDISDISRADAMADAEQLLLDLQREIEEYQARIAALTADDAKAQLDKALRLQQQQAERARDDALDNAAQWQSRVNFLQHEFDRAAQILGFAKRVPIRVVMRAIEELMRKAGAINLWGINAREAA